MKKQVMLNEGKLKAIVAEALKNVLKESNYEHHFEKKYPTDMILESMYSIDDVYSKDDDWYEQIAPQLKDEYAVEWTCHGTGYDERGNREYNDSEYEMCSEFYADINRLQIEGWPELKDDLMSCGDWFINEYRGRIEDDAIAIEDEYFTRSDFDWDDWD